MIKLDNLPLELNLLKIISTGDDGEVIAELLTENNGKR